MSETTTSLLQDKINARAQKRLHAEVAAAVAAIHSLSHKMRNNYQPITADIGQHGAEVDGKQVKIPCWLAIDRIAELLKSELLERYIGEDTAAFLSQVDRVVDLVQEQEQ